MSFQILSLSGGGFLGLYSIAVLAALEQKAGRPIAQCFDLVAGTSVGGIIALGLALEKPASKIKEAFEENGTAIFSSRPAPTTRLGLFRDVLRFLGKPKYTAAKLRETIVAIVGEETRIGDLKHPAIVPAVNLTKGRPQVFKTPHHKSFERDLYLKVVDVALATAAAPTFFPIAEIGDSLFVDGGLFANSPDLMALHEAEHFFQVSPQDIRLLSVGTTTSQFSFSHANGRNYGLFDWAKGQKLVQTMISSQQSAVDFMVGHKLGAQYMRIDALQSKEQERDLGLDVATDSAKRTIRGLAEGSIQEKIGHQFVQLVLSHTAPKAHFFHSLGER